MFQFTAHFANLFKPVILQLRFVGACFVLGFFGWSIARFVLDVVAQAKKMHRIPCTKCRFFTGDYRLKCTVNPSTANTEQAIGCYDYQQAHQNLQNL